VVELRRHVECYEIIVLGPRVQFCLLRLSCSDHRNPFILFPDLNYLSHD
jgi:hypothetical protein